MVNRVIRDDPSKSSMHNRQPVTLKLLWESLKDYDIWSVPKTNCSWSACASGTNIQDYRPLYLLGMLYAVPWTPVNKYLTLSLTGLGFSTFQTNLLTIPATALSSKLPAINILDAVLIREVVITMLILTYVAEITRSITFVAMFGQFWVLPFLIWLEVGYTAASNKWVVYAVMILLLGYPNRKLSWRPWPEGGRPVLTPPSPSDSGRVDLAKLQRCPPPYRLDGDVQYVSADRRDYWI